MTLKKKWNSINGKWNGMNEPFLLLYFYVFLYDV